MGMDGKRNGKTNGNGNVTGTVVESVGLRLWAGEQSKYLRSIYNSIAYGKLRLPLIDSLSLSTSLGCGIAANGFIPIELCP